METGRELFNLFLRGEPLSRPPFLPLLRGLLARVGGTSVQALTSDPTAWAGILLKTADLFDLDGVVAGFHFSLMAEACGCRIEWENDRPVILPPAGGLRDRPEEAGRMKIALETASRVFQVCRSRRACVAALTGPLTLAHHLFGGEGPERLSEVKEHLTRATEAFCRVRPDVIIFLEGRSLTAGGQMPGQRRLYGTLRKIAGHYGITTGLYLQGYEPEDLDRLTDLDLDVYILGPSSRHEPPPPAALEAIAGRALGVGLGLPWQDIEASRRAVDEGEALYRARDGRGFFFTSFGPLTRQVNLEALHELTRLIRRVRR
ncbi:MAG: uroporphyrinogen decarboxylase family protein [Thermodesulfobacteriota bacterium]